MTKCLKIGSSSLNPVLPQVHKRVCHIFLSICSRNCKYKESDIQKWQPNVFGASTAVQQAYHILGPGWTNLNQHNCKVRQESQEEINMTKTKGNLHVVEEIYNQIPAFTDVFSEDTFYMFVVIFVSCTIMVAFILSRFITIKPVE